MCCHPWLILCQACHSRTGLLERSGLDLTKDHSTQTESGLGSGDMARQRFFGGGNYRLLLLDSEQHTEKHVVSTITFVVPGITDEQAANCYHTAKQLGLAIVTTCLKEHAEFYAQQLQRSGCNARIEPDTSTL